MENLIMDKEKRTPNKQEITGSCTHKKSFKERCKECNAIPLYQFEKEFWEVFYEGYRTHGKR